MHLSNNIKDFETSAESAFRIKKSNRVIHQIASVSMPNIDFKQQWSSFWLACDPACNRTLWSGRFWLASSVRYHRVRNSNGDSLPHSKTTYQNRWSRDGPFSPGRIMTRPVSGGDSVKKSCLAWSKMIAFVTKIAEVLSLIYFCHR